MLQGHPFLLLQQAGGELIFAENILALAHEGADIIVDDIFYKNEPFFQDGVIAQAVDEVFDNGVAYFSSAGNRSDRAYESTAINFITDTIGGSTGQFYDFDTSAGVDTRQRITISEGAVVSFSFQWDDPFYTIDGVDTDLDILLINAATGEVVSGETISGGTDDNIAMQTPSELLEFVNNTGQTEFDVAIRLNTGPEPGRIKYVNFDAPIIFNEFRTNSPTVNPHAAATGGKAVAAVPFFSQENPEDFTSQGPNTILFDIYGNRLATPEVRQTPDFAAIDNTDTTFFGDDLEGDGNFFPNFSGTSAAAPHAAAIAALIKEANPHPSTIKPFWQ